MQEKTKTKINVCENMFHNRHKILPTLAVCLGMLSTPPIHAVSTTKSIQYTAALLRGPAAYFEHRLRDDTSFRAHTIKVAIHSIRLLDDLLSPTTSQENVPNKDAFMEVITGLSTWQHPVGWCIYDSVTIIKELKACLTGKNASLCATTDDQEHEFLRSVILPAAEMICALVRATSTASKRNNLANIGISMARLCQLYYAAPQNSAKRKVIGGLLVACIIEFLVKDIRPSKRQPMSKTLDKRSSSNELLKHN